MLCDMVPESVWGDQHVTAIRNMLETVSHGMSDCDFFVNKRDTACVRLDNTDPMNPLDCYQFEVVDHKRLLPVLSFYTGDQYADLAMPSAVDWVNISRSVFAQSCKPRLPDEDYAVTYWDIKLPVAVFRGSMTGVGLTPRTNQRMHLCSIAHPHLDAKATSVSRRVSYCPVDKRIGLKTRMDASPANYMSLKEQQETYKYTICVDGHSAPDRLGSLLRGHQCIIKVDPPLHALCGQSWLSDFMYPWEHYIPVHRDMSNLGTQIEWATSNDRRCKEICDNCTELHNTVMTKKTVHAWWEMVSSFIS